MTSHKTGTREEWLAARLALLKEEKELTRRSDEIAGAATGAAVGPNRQDVQVRHRRGQRFARGPLQRAFAAAHLSLHVRARLHGGMSHPARRLRMASTGSRSISPTTTSCSGPCRGRRSRSCWPTNVEWAGRFRGHRRTPRTSTPTSPSASPSSSSAREASNTTTAARSRFPTAAKERRSSRRRPEPMLRRSPANGQASARSSSRTALSTTPIPPTRAAWTASGACTSGSIVRRKDATNTTRGGRGMTSTRQELGS